MAQYTRIGSGGPQSLGSITITGATIGALTVSVPKATALTCSSYNALKALQRDQIVFFTWDNTDGTTWDAGLFILPSRVYVSSGTLKVDFNCIGASSFTPADHTYQVWVP